jgi:hypothetical protein
LEEDMRTTTFLLSCLATLTLSACPSDGDDGQQMEGSTGAAMDGSGSGTEADPTADPTVDPTGLETGNDSMGDSTGMPAALDCAEYCGIYMDACVDFTEYANEQECMDQCGQWPIGDAADTAGDTLGCRLYHVTVASSADPALHCPHAGPSGDATCADAGAPTCVDYCDTYFDNCTGDLNVYTDVDDCLAQCAPWYPGAVGDTAGNSIGCRTYHSGAPAVGDPDLHCPHAAPGGGGVCVYE